MKKSGQRELYQGLTSYIGRHKSGIYSRILILKDLSAKLLIKISSSTSFSFWVQGNNDNFIKIWFIDSIN